MDFIVRIDDRLIHGQVTAGWVRPLGIERIMLANDQIAQDEWQQEIYTLAVPPEIEVKIAMVSEAVHFLKGWQDGKKTMILINSFKDALHLVEQGVKINKVNVGGLHYEQGKREFTSYIFLSSDDVRDAQQLLGYGVVLEGREIPGGPSIILDSLIREIK
jgi:PTS system mannose-specific IIB component